MAHGLYIVYMCLFNVFSMCVLQARYQNVNQISLEFAQGVEDKHMELLKKKVICILIKEPVKHVKVGVMK